METSKPGKKVLVKFHGHEWPVYPLKSRKATVYRVIHRINGQRRPKTFTTLAKAKADALAILKEIFVKGDSKVHLTNDEKLDWKSAVGVLQQAGIRSSLETVCRHYADLAEVVGNTALLTDVVRKYANTRGKAIIPIKLTSLREAYVATLKKKALSARHIEAEESHSGQFIAFAKNAVSDCVTCSQNSPG